MRQPEPSAPPVPTPAGLLVIDKPLKRTSMDICRLVRRRLVLGGAPKRVKVGHGGTLDPLATGVLVILVGKATRRCEEIMAGVKVYETSIDFSSLSATDDLERELTHVGLGSRAVPPTLDEVRAACAAFTGVIQQRPPAYSAMKVNGKRAYKLARAGKEVVLAPRPVRIDAIEIKAYAWPSITLEITCGKGTYIRSLGRDLGAHLGVGGVLTALRRTRVGQFSIEQARSVESLPGVMGQGDLANM